MAASLHRPYQTMGKIIRRQAVAVVTSLCVLSSSVFAATAVGLPPNRYSPRDDVQIGQKAAADARRQLPMVRDAQVQRYVSGLGQRLVSVVPSRLRHSGFRYSFETVNQREINAFALPGGPMFVNRGVLEAARSEGQVAGVMAHELAHVVLRHGTAQATRGQKFQLGAVAGQILGSIVGGPAGNIIAQGSNIGLSTYFMKYSREYERQADILGAQLMARAGYDPREMAAMFRTMQSGGPEWLSDHPNPGNRSAYITQEARTLRVAQHRSDGEFQQIQRRLGVRRR
jgi:predicted Zn-dependent protease